MKEADQSGINMGDHIDNHEKNIRYGEVVIINPPLYPHEGKLSLGQLASEMLVDVTYRYFQSISSKIKYASCAYNSQGKPVELEQNLGVDLTQFIDGALIRTAMLVQQMEREKEQLGMSNTGFEFIDTQSLSHEIVQKRFLELYKRGFLQRNNHHFYLDTGLVLKTFNVEQMLKAVDFHPANLVNTINQLLSDATSPVALTKERLFATPLPIYVCNNCELDFIQENLMLPVDPRLTPHECPSCHGLVVNDPRDTIAPLFDLTQQRFFLSESPDATVIQICGMNVLTNYIFFSLLVNIALDERPPFDVLVAHGYLNDHFGKRMSRRNNNMIYVDELLLLYHPDAIRYSIFKSVTQNDIAGNFDEYQLKSGQKFIYKIGNLRKFFVSNRKDLKNTPYDEDLLSRYRLLMEKFEFKHAFAVAEEYLSRISSDIVIERDSGAIDIDNKATRYKTAIRMLQPFLPTIVDRTILELF